MGKSKKHDKKSKKKRKCKDKQKDKQKDLSKKLKKSQNAETNDCDGDFAIPVELMNSKSHAPETPEEYQKRQSQIRREVDPITGRMRLIKGDSEILEEIVSKRQHVEINKKATKADGNYYEKKLSLTKRN